MLPTTLSRRFIHPALALGVALLWGLVEFVALARSRWAARLQRGR